MFFFFFFYIVVVSPTQAAESLCLSRAHIPACSSNDAREIIYYRRYSSLLLIVQGSQTERSKFAENLAVFLIPHLAQGSTSRLVFNPLITIKQTKDGEMSSALTLGCERRLWGAECGGWGWETLWANNFLWINEICWPAKTKDPLLAWGHWHPLSDLQGFTVAVACSTKERNMEATRQPARISIAVRLPLSPSSKSG